MPPTESRTTIALAHGNEWLDSSKDFADLDAQTRHKILRQGRAIVMELITALEGPKNLTEPRTTSTPIAEGLTAERKPIYSGASFSEMIGAILTAKRMGAVNFEIEVREVKQGYSDRGSFESPWELMLGARSVQGTQIELTIFAVLVR